MLTPCLVCCSSEAQLCEADGDDVQAPDRAAAGGEPHTALLDHRAHDARYIQGKQLDIIISLLP